MSESSQPATSPAPPGSAPSRHPVIQVVVAIGLLVLLVWWLKPRKFGFKPAPFAAVQTGPDCPRLIHEFVPSNYTEIPAQLAGLSDEQKNGVRFRMNMEPCPCGCNLSIAACRANHAHCPTSQRLQDKIAAEEREEGTDLPTESSAQAR